VKHRRGGPAPEPGMALLSESLVRELMRQLVGVVAYIHSQDISHRNISPENCLLDYDESGSSSGVGVTLQLSNFGFASSFGDNTAMQTKIETGHIDFCAPEMILQESGYGKEVDLWSVGVLAMMLLGGGRAPFRKESLGGPLDTGASGVSASSTGPHSGDESGLSTAAAIENITQAKFDFVPEEIWRDDDRYVHAICSTSPVHAVWRVLPINVRLCMCLSLVCLFPGCEVHHPARSSFARC